MSDGVGWKLCTSAPGGDQRGDLGRVAGDVLRHVGDDGEGGHDLELLGGGGAARPSAIRAADRLVTTRNIRTPRAGMQEI